MLRNSARVVLALCVLLLAIPVLGGSIQTAPSSGGNPTALIKFLTRGPIGLVTLTGLCALAYGAHSTGTGDDAAACVNSNLDHVTSAPLPEGTWVLKSFCAADIFNSSADTGDNVDVTVNEVSFPAGVKTLTPIAATTQNLTAVVDGYVLGTRNCTGDISIELDAATTGLAVVFTNGVDPTNDVQLTLMATIMIEQTAP